MASTLNSDNGVVSGSAGLKSSADSSGVLALQTNGTTAVTVDTSQNVGVGVTPSAWISTYKALEFGSGSIVYPASATNFQMAMNGYVNSGGSWTYKANGYSSLYAQNAGAHQWFNAASGTAGGTITFTQAMTLDSSGNLLVGTTSQILTEKFGVVNTGDVYVQVLKGGTVNQYTQGLWNPATSGNNLFTVFLTEGTATARGSITYFRAGGVTSFNTTSDYRAKTVNGPVENALSRVALLKPSTGRMNGAEIDIDFFVAHELQEVVPCAVTGKKDAVNEDGTPNYQMVDKSALIPLLTAAIQEQQATITQLQADVAALKA